MEAVIDTIIDQARTGEIGDGKIFGMWSYKYLFICFIYLQFVYVAAEILHNTEKLNFVEYCLANFFDYSVWSNIMLCVGWCSVSCFGRHTHSNRYSLDFCLYYSSLVCLHPFLNLWLAPPSKCCSIYVFIPEKCCEPGFGCFWIRRTRVKGRENGWWASWYAGIRWWHRWCLREASQIL